MATTVSTSADAAQNLDKQKDAIVVESLETATITSPNDEAAEQKHSKGGRPKFSYQSPSAKLVDRFIDEPRPLRVAVIGGGLSGILAGILLPKKVPGIQLTIFEKNKDFGGTWLENSYPGVRCDIPSHVYQSTFIPNKNWSDEFAPGREILKYWQKVAHDHEVYQYAKFGHKVESIDWDSEEGIWSVTTQNVKDGGNTLGQKFDFVITAIGRFNAWKLPDYPGISDFKGFLRHSSHWDPSFDPVGKRVAVIGNGASGIQLVANLQKVVGQLDHYARNPTWIATSWAGDDRTLEPQPISDDQKQTFKDPKEYLSFRKSLEDKYWRRFDTFLRSPENEELKAKSTSVMKERLQKKPHLIEHLVPDFSPNCRRLTPGPGYLEAITSDNVDYINTPIKRFTETGIETADGTQRDVDAVFCSTGANRDMVPAFAIKSNGKDLRDIWDQDGEHGFPYTYLGISTPGFPNLLFLQGPHGTGPSGTVPHSAETQLSLFAKILRKVSREGIKSISPSARAADDFVEYSDAFFAQTVLSDPCSSWYNGGRPGARIHGLWPGSAAHLTIIRREPRWEDWEYEYLSDNGNRFLWYFGNGWTRLEKDPDSDLTPYLKLEQSVDLRDVHESWWSVP